MEKLGPKLSEIRDALWRTKIGQLVATLQARIEQGTPMDPLAQHEHDALKRDDPAQYQRVEKMRRKERQAHHDPWV